MSYIFVRALVKCMIRRSRAERNYCFTEGWWFGCNARGVVPGYSYRARPSRRSGAKKKGVLYRMRS